MRPRVFRQATGFRTVIARTVGNVAPTPFRGQFPLLPGETELPLRLMTDLGSIEMFAAGGRGVYSGGLSHAACARTPCLLTVAALPSPSPPWLAAGAAWEMRSIFS